MSIFGIRWGFISATLLVAVPFFQTLFYAITGTEVPSLAVMLVNLLNGTNIAPANAYAWSVSGLFVIWVVAFIAPFILPWLRIHALQKPPVLTAVEKARIWNKQKDYLKFSSILLIILVLFLVLPTVHGYFRSINATLAWNTIYQFTGREATAGRKDMIETLVKWGEDLSRIDVHHAWLDNLNAENAKMPAAFMMMAHLQGANFKNANLTGAMLPQADLTRADFTRANLSGAVLGIQNVQTGQQLITDAKGQIKTVGTGALYEGADVSGTIFEGANLENAFLRCVKNLKCAQLMKADKWETTYRDEDLDCGEPIPEWKGWDGKGKDKIECPEVEKSDNPKKKDKKG